jgi:hypothetical protein
MEKARSMGIYAAHCMARSLQLESEGISCPRLMPHNLDTVYGNSMLDVFAHITHFFDYNVVLLGRYNAQGLGAHLEGCSKEIVVTAGETMVS